MRGAEVGRGAEMRSVLRCGGVLRGLRRGASCTGRGSHP